MEKLSVKREQLIKQIEKELLSGYSAMGSNELDCVTSDMIAGFIIEDRRRICEPIIAYKNMVAESGDKWPQGMEDIAIDETLRNLEGENGE